MISLLPLTLLLPILAGAAPAPAAMYRPAMMKRDGVSYVLPSQQDKFSGDVTQCKGYSLDTSSIEETSTGGLSADLSIISTCDAYGTDIANLKLSVEYETDTRLHVHIYDADLKQYQLSESILSLPERTLTGSDSNDKSALEFGYDESPFAFWVTRKEDGEVLFDTRASGIPTYNEPVEINGVLDNHTVIPGNALIFEDQYLQLSSKLPKGANIYGLGEVISGSGYRRNASGAVQTMWARDIADPVDENIYGSHPIYMEARPNEANDKLASHGVFLRNSHGMDVVLRDEVIQYRVIGGTLDLYFTAGPSPIDVVKQHAAQVGLPASIPEWAFGFHLCRWGYSSLNETKSVVKRMRDSGIPLETQWNDIDYMAAYRDFTFDINYPVDEFKAFIEELHANGQHYIPIIDAAIPHILNKTDVYDLYTRGHELNVWMKNPDGSEYVGAVWPTFSVFPDWFHPNIQQVWTEAFKNFSEAIDYDGIWLDMNEPSSFIDGSAANATSPLENTTIIPPNYSDVAFPPDFPEGYYSNVSGLSGNISINGSLTYGKGGDAVKNTALRRRDFVYGQIPYVDFPPYQIRNMAGSLSAHTVSVNSTHYGGLQEYSVHNVWGTMECKATHNSLLEIKPGKRPFIVGRSTFPGAGSTSGHWTGDNFATWAYMKRSIQGVLQFNLFAQPMTGADVCGFNGETNEELCNRWMQLGAFTPFYRNHNIKSALSQEPYIWDSVRDASIKAINARLTLLPYWNTLFAIAALDGTPPVQPLFHQFQSADYLDNDSQFIIGESVIVTPVLQPNESTTTGQFPTTNGVFWVDWWTHERLDTSKGDNVTLDLPLGNIGVHVRSGSALLLYNEPGYTIKETRENGYAVLVVLDGKGYAEGVAKVDDGESLPVTEQTCLTFTSTDATKLTSTPVGSYTIPQNLKTITVVGVWSKPEDVTINGKTVDRSQVAYNESTGEVTVSGLDEDLNQAWELKW